uniref:Gamma-glutamyltranspeptidase 1 n=1 Tax=Plectus sambesii TaxID=2011161 RepID=A0A914W3U8_9BILA
MPEYSERTPLNDTKRERSSALYWIAGLSSLLAVLLLASTITLAVLYANNQPKSGTAALPKWPSPSLSPLGKYTDAAVAADNGYCSEIGRDILLKGGNAVDAAIAALFCIGVMDSHSAGMGGGHFMTIYNATTRKCHVVDARETAPAIANETMFVRDPVGSKIGWKAIAVPGELHGLWTEYTRFGGALPWKDLLEPTINLMNEGYPTSNALAKALQDMSKVILNEPTMSVFINPQTGNLYKAGEQIVTRQTFMNTLQIIANSTDPIKDFYDGKLTAQMIEEFQRNGGLITAEDMRNYKSIVRDDSEVIYTRLPSNRTICGPPPPSGSAIAQAILSILDGFKLNQSTFEDNVDLYHRLIEASKFAYADRSVLGDMAFITDALPVARNITSQEYAAAIRKMITDRAHPEEYYGGDFGVQEDHGTTHITVMDRFGNAVAVTSTINLLFGAVVRSNSTGIVWNDEMDDFSTPGQPNYFGYPPSKSNFIVPNKRPMSSMSPIVIFDGNTGRPELAAGGAGGSTIISGVAGVALHALWLGADIKQSVDAPRLHNQLRPPNTQYETTFPAEYVAALTARGQTMTPVNNLTVITAIERGVDGSTYANSDFRKGTESYPAGY